MKTLVHRAVPPTTGALALALVVAAGCLPRVERTEPIDVTHVYTCDGDVRFSVRQFGDVATVRQPMQTLALPRVRVASGVRYSSDEGEFRSEGQTATLTVGSTRHTGCTPVLARTPEDVARLLGVEYRAVGRQPTWSLEIDESNYMRFVIEGSTAIHAPIPAPGGDSARRVYVATSGATQLEAIVADRTCRDPRSDEAYPHSVTVMYNGFPYPGCGGPLAPEPSTE